LCSLACWAPFSERCPGINTRDLNRSCAWFHRHGDAVVFWGRLLPGVRTLISLPAGIEMMPIVPFLIFTTAGSLIWILLLTIAGLLLGESYRNVELWIEPVARLIKVLLLVGLLIGAVWLALRALRNSRNSL
jgi:membrane protein DedA with SNARE-associated domain